LTISAALDLFQHQHHLQRDDRESLVEGSCSTYPPSFQSEQIYTVSESRPDQSHALPGAFLAPS
jgi:hypothetical protein